MGILQRLGNWRLDDGVDDNAKAAAYLLGGGGDVAQVEDLPASVAQAFGLSLGDSIDRKTAMRIPTVRRARQVVCGTIGTQTLVAHRTNGDGSVVDVTADRPLLTQPDPNAPLHYTLTWTIDDLWFYGISWWHVLERDPQGFPKRATRLDRDRISYDRGLRKYVVDGVPVQDDADLIRFDGPDEGLLAYAGDTLSTSRLIQAAVRKFASFDIPQGALVPVDGSVELSTEPGSAGIEGSDDSEVDALLDAWEHGRRTRTTAYLGAAVDYKTFTLDAAQAQLAEGRAQQRIDDANVCNVPPRAVNAASADSMTYSTSQADRADLVDTSMRGLIVAVEQRLSLGDVTPRGTVVRLDLSRYLQGDPKTALDAAQIAVTMGAMTKEEVRTDVLGRAPLNEGQTP